MCVSIFISGPFLIGVLTFIGLEVMEGLEGEIDWGGETEFFFSILGGPSLVAKGGSGGLSPPACEDCGEYRSSTWKEGNYMNEYF